MSIASASAASKPAKVTGVKASAKKMSVTLKWKKAKRAKKYQIWQYKAKKYKKIKTTKAKKITIKKLKAATTYKFKVRAINGKKAGKFSKVVVIKTKAVNQNDTNNSSAATNTAVNPAKAKLKKGKTYLIKKGAENIKVKITDYDRDGKDISIEGKTASGGTYGYTKNSDVESCYIEEKGFTKHFDYKDMESDFTGVGKILIVKDDQTKAYCTLDGTEPAIGQEDLIGYSKYCTLVFPDGWNNESVSEENQQYLLEKWGYNPKTAQIRTKLRMTASKGKTKFWIEPHNGNPCYEWIKVYTNNKLIWEYNGVAY